MRLPRRTRLGCLILIAALLLACGDGGKTSHAITLQDINGRKIQVELSSGAHWFASFKVGWFRVKAAPQFVLWIEDADGNYIDTLYITRKFAKQSWGARGQEAGKTFRQEALPYWLHQRLRAGFPPPTKREPLPDAISSPTPKGKFVLSSKAAAILKEANVMLEINGACDGNESFPNNAPEGSPAYNGASGQPAVVYQALVDLSRPGSYDFKPIGYSSPSGANGLLYSDLKKLTTALQMIQSARVVVE